MKERPILFSAQMVKAILDDRKTQTRRLVKVEIPLEPTALITKREADFLVERWPVQERMMGNFGRCENILCPYGVPGDRLWVRETGWERPERTPRMMREGADTWEKYYYDADGLGEADHEQFKAWGFKRRPAIHMPRWASRITLEVTDVRVQRLQDISEEDAKAEGVVRLVDEVGFRNYHRELGKVIKAMDAVTSFRSLWDSINADRAPWASNPWVWGMSFKRLADG